MAGRHILNVVACWQQKLLSTVVAIIWLYWLVANNKCYLSRVTIICCCTWVVASKTCYLWPVAIILFFWLVANITCCLWRVAIIFFMWLVAIILMRWLVAITAIDLSCWQSISVPVACRHYFLHVPCIKDLYLLLDAINLFIYICVVCSFL